MPFFARPNLDDVQFKQLSGSTLTLSGVTSIWSPDGLTLTDGAGGYVPIVATGGTDYDVLTYVGGKIILEPASGGGAGVYSGASPTTCTVGGINAGTAIYGCSISSILETMLVPDIPLCVCLTIPSPRQFGCSVNGSLSWYVTMYSNPISGIVASDSGDGVYDVVIFSGGTTGTTSGSITAWVDPNMASPSAVTSSTSETFYLSAVTTAGETDVCSATLTWMNSRHWGSSTTNYIIADSGSTNTAIDTFSSELSATGIKCFCNYSNGLSSNYFYYAYPSTFGAPVQITVNGLPNNSWGCAAIGTLSTFTRCNTNGYCQAYYLVRSDNQFSGSVNVNITTVS
jgi:hypothetical protein